MPPLRLDAKSSANGSGAGAAPGPREGTAGHRAPCAIGWLSCWPGTLTEPSLCGRPRAGHWAHSGTQAWRIPALSELTLSWGTQRETLANKFKQVFSESGKKMKRIKQEVGKLATEVGGDLGESPGNALGGRQALAWEHQPSRTGLRACRQGAAIMRCPSCPESLQDFLTRGPHFYFPLGPVDPKVSPVRLLRSSSLLGWETKKLCVKLP